MKLLIWILVLGLLIAHQDNWNWNDDTLVFGFLPIGLFYHACISLAAGIVWWMACLFAWPKELEEYDEGGNLVSGSPKAGSPKAGSPKAGSPKAGSPKAGSPNAGNPNAGNPNAATTVMGDTIVGEGGQSL